MSKNFTHSSKRNCNNEFYGSSRESERERERVREERERREWKRERERERQKIIIMSSHKHISPGRERDMDEILFLVAKLYYINSLSVCLINLLHIAFSIGLFHMSFDIRLFSRFNSKLHFFLSKIRYL